MKDVAGGSVATVWSPVSPSQLRLYLAFSLYLRKHLDIIEIDMLPFISSHTAATHSIVFRKFNKNS